MTSHHQIYFEKVEENILIYFDNINGLLNHTLKISNDLIISTADILSFVETWSRKDQVYNIRRFDVLSRIDGTMCTGSTKPPGVVIAYIKPYIVCS